MGREVVEMVLKTLIPSTNTLELLLRIRLQAEPWDSPANKAFRPPAPPLPIDGTGYSLTSSKPLE